MEGNESYWTEMNSMDCNIKVLLWIMTGDDESYCYLLEQGLLQLENTLQNVIGVDESYWDGNALNSLKCEGYDMECHGRQ